MLTVSENRFVTSATWQEYEKFLEAVGERPIRLTYDRGRLEIFSPSLDHKKAKSLLGTLLEALLFDWDRDYEAGGSTTFRRQDLDRGLEPDECYWFEQARAIRKVGTIDLARDPAPELVIEVEITCSVLNRLGLFHSLGVAEIWRLTQVGQMVVLGWSEAGYQVLPVSRVLAGFPVPELTQWLDTSERTRPQLLREFLRWARAYKP